MTEVKKFKLFGLIGIMQDILKFLTFSKLGFYNSCKAFLSFFYSSLLSFSLAAGAITLIFPQNSYALAPTWSVDVTPGDDSNFKFPSVKVKIKRELDSVTRTLTHGECSFMGIIAIRVCARIVKPIGEKRPGDKGYSLTDPNANLARSNYGNSTGVEGNPRTQICAYEDPCDAGDPANGKCFGSDNKSPFYEHQSRETAISDTNLIISTSVTIIGMAMAMAIQTILKYYNHIVVSTLGCVDIPIAPSPTEWCNNCWNVHFLPLPKMEILPSATFFDPTIKVTTCKKSAKDNAVTACVCTVSDTNNTLADCSVPGTVVKPDLIKETFTLNANDAHKKVDGLGMPLFQECATSNDGADSREFCASVTTERPQEVCASIRNPNSQNKLIKVGCFPRPDWMIKPTIKEVGLLNGGETIRVTYNDKAGTVRGTLDLTEDAALVDGDPATTPTLAWTSNCGYLQQIEFCITRPCAEYNTVSTTVNGVTTKVSTGVCKTYDTKSCISGYESPYGVAINTSSNTVISGVPNIMAPFLGNQWIYNPPHCYQRDQNTKDCLNYADLKDGGVCCSATAKNCPNIVGPYLNPDGSCAQYVRNTLVNNVVTDNYKLDTSPIDPNCTTNRSVVTTPGTSCQPKVSIRDLTPEEAGMCINLPSSNGVLIKNGSASGVYRVPDNCGRIKVRMWGGGSAGAADQGDDGDDYVGASAAHVDATLRVSSGQNINYVVGSGGNGDRGRPGSDTYFTSVDNPQQNYINAKASPGYRVEGKNNISDWRWNNVSCKAPGDALNTPESPCYIKRIRDGIAGYYQEDEGGRGTAGGNVPDSCFYSIGDGAEKKWMIRGNTNRSGLVCTEADNDIPFPPGFGGDFTNGDSNYIGCIRYPSYVPHRSETNFIPEEPTEAEIKATGWPFAWPGAGGCSYDGDDSEPWGYGADGRIEISCVGGQYSGSQADCAAINKRLKYFDDSKGKYIYYNCHLPAAKHGDVATQGEIAAPIGGGSGGGGTSGSGGDVVPGINIPLGTAGLIDSSKATTPPPASYDCIKDNSIAPNPLGELKSYPGAPVCMGGLWTF